MYRLEFAYLGDISPKIQLSENYDKLLDRFNYLCTLRKTAFAVIFYTFEGNEEIKNTYYPYNHF